MDTIDPMVVPDLATGAPSPEAPHPPFNRLLWALPVVLFVLALGALLNVNLPYFAIAPGDARTVDDLIAAPDGRAHPPRGRLYLATVSLQRVKALGALRGWLDEDIDVVHENRILGDTPRREYRRQNLQLMDDSKENALVVGLRYLGYDVPEQGKGALVVGVAKGMPAANRIEPGDVILSIDGTPTLLREHLVDAVRARKPGDAVRLEVADPDGKTRVEQITLAEQDGGPILGVSLRTKDRTFDLPFDVKIESAGIGGPSAGLAFTLGLIDKLSSGELTGGQRVAVTGEIKLDGAVGAVGGVGQKAAAVRAEGLRYFIVPPSEYDTARRHAGKNLTILKAGTLEEAIAALGSIGGDIEGVKQAAAPAPVRSVRTNRPGTVESSSQNR